MKILQNFPGLMFPWNIEAGPMLVFLSAAHFCRSLNRGQLIMLGIVNIQQLLLPLTCFLPVAGSGSLESDWENADELLPLEPTPVQLCLRRRRRRCCNEHPVECDVTTRLDTGPRDNYNTAAPPSLHSYTTTALFLSA